MNALYPTLFAFVCMFLGYRFYSKYLSKKVFILNDNNTTPAVAMQDGMDYVPTRRLVLFSHHFASIAGLSPIVGPAVAVIWGWFPAILWLVFGAVLMGAVHDFAALVISIRHKGRSIGDVCETLIGKRARIWFLFIIYIALALAMGAFTSIVGNLLQMESDNVGFQTYPGAALPAIMLMIIAMFFGVLLRKKKITLLPVSIVGLGLTLFFIWLGTYVPINFSLNFWLYALLAYALAASVLPVWLLLQPRDYINTLSLYLGLIGLYLAVIFFAPTIVAPAVNSNAELPSMFPLLFVTIACGAVYGFHSVVSSGTTAKQIEKESDARSVGYGAMIAECGLGVMAVLACTAGVESLAAWEGHYSSWKTGGLYGSISFFVMGAGNFIHQIGIPLDIASTFVALLIVSFALTTLDSGTRLLRYNLEEIGDTFKIPLFNNRYISSSLAVLTIAFFAMSSFGKSLWILFGTVNQLLAALGLLAATVYLVRLQRNIWVTALPMVFMLGVTLTAMTLNLQTYVSGLTAGLEINDAQQIFENTSLTIVGGIIYLLTIALIFEAIYFFFSFKPEPQKEALAEEPAI